MPVIAVVNRKGGSGKSTMAAHLAAWCARQGHAVVLGDVDHQQSSRAWLRRRDPNLPAITPWAMDPHALKVPSGISHVILDTPGGIRGFDLARVVMFADAIVIPVSASMFDRESAAMCHAELSALPRVASGRCRVGVVGMRIDGRTQAITAMTQWAQELGVQFLGAVREAQVYVRSLDRGMTIFDLPPQQAASDLAQWAPIQEWLAPVVGAPRTSEKPAASPAPATPVAPPRPVNLMPAQEPLVHGTRLGVLSSARLEAHRASPRALACATHEVPQFLKR